MKLRLYPWELGLSAGLLMLAGWMLVRGLLPLWHGPLLLTLLFCLWWLRDRRGGWIWLLTLFVGLFTAVFRPDNFDYPQLIEPQRLYASGKWFEWHLNLGKALVGYLLLIWLWRDNPRLPWWLSVMAGVAGIMLILLSGWLMGLAVMPKLPVFLWLFALGNLFVTVVAEEAFFRLLIQRFLMNALPGWRGAWLGLGVSTLLFTAVHVPQTLEAGLLIGVAGLVYAGVYLLTGRWLISVLCHWGVNLGHLLLFAYPF